MSTNDTIKVFVGCDPNNCDLEQMMVLDYSIHRHTSMPVEIVWMQLSRDPDSYWYSNPETGKGWDTTKWSTPFSGFRWAIPEYCNYSGRAIYMDADVVILDDLAKLWQNPIEGQSIVSAKTNADMTRLCTCIWDCPKARKYIPSVEQLKDNIDSHKEMMKLFKKNKKLIEPYQDSYNCIDGENLAIEEIKILHYSDMGTQFSHKYSLPRVNEEGVEHWFDGEVLPHPRQDLVDLFDDYYNEALAAGYDLENYRIEPFGNFPKKSQQGYIGNKVTRPKSSKSLFAKLFKR
ncbi:MULTISPECIES: glycosyltransferase [unclassified Psychrobacter]|uniref:glycosyltransferase n=1 Tax=unclassified Psychrobacter TaxID=196806 RepID=UPI00071E8CFE|nr:MULTISPECIES: glycosyltransferase [unclassified Psychrobacter]OLF38380.1 glycosyl transferase [Psychrobacter sp. Cmf 22.2]